MATRSRVAGSPCAKTLNGTEGCLDIQDMLLHRLRGEQVLVVFIAVGSEPSCLYAELKKRSDLPEITLATDFFR